MRSTTLILEYQICLARAARKRGLLNLTFLIPNFAAPDDPQLWRDFRINPQRFFGGTPRPQNIFDFVLGKTKHIATNAGAAVLSGALLAIEAALILSGKRAGADIVTAPKATYLGLFQRSCLVHDPRGTCNP